MAIKVFLDQALSEQEMTLAELSRRAGISEPNLSILKLGKSKAIRFSTLNAICKALDCQPGHLLEYVPDEEAQEGGVTRSPDTGTWSPEDL